MRRSYSLASATTPKSYHSTSSFFSFVFHPLFLTFWILACLLISFSLWRTTLQVQHAKSRIDDANSRVKEEEQRGFSIIDKLNEADTKFAQEKIIRDELNMQKPGEIILQLPSTPTP